MLGIVATGPARVVLTEVGFNDKVSSAKIDSITSSYSVAGEWQLRTLESGTTYTWTKQATISKDETYGSTMEKALTTAMSAGIEYKGIGVEASAEYSVTSTESVSWSESLTSTEQQTCTTTCDQGKNLWQWALYAEGPGFASQVHTCLALCVTAGLEPQCFPNLATDEDYQNCTS